MISLRSIAAGTLALSMAASAALAQDKRVVLKLSYWVPPTHALTPGYKEWDEALRKATNGTLSIQLFPSSQLGSGPDHYDMVKGGVADIGLINPGYTPGRFPVIAVAELPFQTKDSHATAAALTKWYRQYADKEMPDVMTCHAFSHEPGTFHMTKKEVRRPEDIRGMKIRAGNATISEYITTLGGTPIQVPIMEALETLNRGMVEGITIPWGGLVTMNFGTVALLAHDVDEELDAQIIDPADGIDAGGLAAREDGERGRTAERVVGVQCGLDAIDARRVHVVEQGALAGPVAGP